jgi:hypothetical protein
MGGMAEERYRSTGLVDDDQGSEEERKNHSCDGIAFHGWPDARGSLLGKSKPLEVSAVKPSSDLMSERGNPQQSG